MQTNETTGKTHNILPSPPLSPETILKVLKGEPLEITDMYEIKLTMSAKDTSLKSIEFTGDDVLPRLNPYYIEKVQSHIDEGLRQTVFYHSEVAKTISIKYEERRAERMKNIETGVVDNSLRE